MAEPTPEETAQEAARTIALVYLSNIEHTVSVFEAVDVIMAQLAAGLRPNRRQIQIVRDQLQRGIAAGRDLRAKILKNDGGQH